MHHFRRFCIHLCDDWWSAYRWFGRLSQSLVHVRRMLHHANGDRMWHTIFGHGDDIVCRESCETDWWSLVVRSSVVPSPCMMIQSFAQAVWQQRHVGQGRILAYIWELCRNCAGCMTRRSWVSCPFVGPGRPTGSEVDGRSFAAVTDSLNLVVLHWQGFWSSGPVTDETVLSKMPSCPWMGVSVRCITTSEVARSGPSWPGSLRRSIAGLQWFFCSTFHLAVGLELTCSCQLFDSQARSLVCKNFQDELRSVIVQKVCRTTKQNDPIVNELGSNVRWCYWSDRYGFCQFRESVCSRQLSVDFPILSLGKDLESPLPDLQVSKWQEQA